MADETSEPDRVWLKGEGGGVFLFDLPLSPDIAKAYAKQALTRVNEDGTPFVEDPEPADLTPKQKLQADARELGVDDSGTVADIQARIDAKLAAE